MGDLITSVASANKAISISDRKRSRDFLPVDVTKFLTAVIGLDSLLA
jgi:hypothetical protein